MKRFMPILLYTCIATIITQSPLFGCASCGSTGFGSSSNLYSANCGSCYTGPRTIFIPRSIGAYTSRELLDCSHKNIPCMNGTIAVSVGYQSTTHSYPLADYFFGSDTLSFKGSRVTGRNPQKDLLADYYGMSQKASGTISFSPSIKTFVTDFNLYIGLENWACGLYARIHMPLAYSRWMLNSCCDSQSASEQNAIDTTAFPAGYMNTLTVPTNPQPLSNALNQSISPATSVQHALSGEFTFGNAFKSWAYGRFNTTGCVKGKWNVADVDLILGYDFHRDDCSHCGVYLQAVAPTGTKIDSEYNSQIFNSMVGNGKHWELGTGLSAHTNLISRCGYSLGLYFEGNITHMFANRQVRSFDFINRGSMSRYMLLKEFSVETNPANVIFKNNLFNAIDYATRTCKVSMNGKLDGTLKLELRSYSWNLGLGYNLYARSKEKVCINQLPANQTLIGYYGFKGDSNTDAIGYGVDSATINTVPTAIYSDKNLAYNTNHGLSTTQYTATATAPGAVDSPVNLYINSTGIGPNDGFVYVSAIDNGSLITNPTPVANITIAQESSSKAQLLQQLSTGDLVAIADRIYTPKIIALDQLDARTGAQPRMVSNTFFGTIGYTGCCYNWNPSLDLGLEIDLSDIGACKKVKQYGFWLKGSLCF